MTSSYIKKHEKLIKEENDLKEKLDNEVTKVKEKLENYLSESNLLDLLQINERINKGIQKLDKDKKNIVKKLSYISCINKNQKEMKMIFPKLMKNLKISFIEKESNIKYEEYYFNGIPTPKEIEYKNITSNSVDLLWKIDNFNIINIDNNKIYFKVEIKKDNGKFTQIYEGNNCKYKVEKLKCDTNYEFRICSFYEKMSSSWSEIRKIKTNDKDIDSIILFESQKENEFINQIKEWCGNKKLEYRGTRDGTTSKKFHEKCDDKGPTITLYKNDNGSIFGGYASISWKSEGEYKKTKDCYIFTLKNIHNTKPCKFPVKNDNEGVYHNINFGPTFGCGCDININDDFKIKESNSDFPCRYVDILGKGRSIFTGNNDNNVKTVKIEEIEVFKII